MDYNFVMKVRRMLDSSKMECKDEVVRERLGKTYVHITFLFLANRVDRETRNLVIIGALIED